jgi:hypothetical protein
MVRSGSTVPLPVTLSESVPDPEPPISTDAPEGVNCPSKAPAAEATELPLEVDFPKTVPRIPRNPDFDPLG